MSELLKVNVNGTDYEAGKAGSDILINGNKKSVRLLHSPSKGVNTFTVDGKVYTVSVSDGDDGVTKIHHDGNLYEVESKSAKEALLEKYMAGTGGGADKNKIIKSPMPGLIVKINCALGDSIAKGDKPIVIEAMKMENALASPGAGIVKAINVKEGQAVEKNAILIELE